MGRHPYMADRLPYEVPSELLDFRRALVHIWRHINLPDPNRVQIDIADFMQQQNPRKMVQGFRGVAKSWIACAYSAWRLLLDPYISVMIVSSGADFAKLNSGQVKRIIMDVPFFDVLMPGPDHRRSVELFDVGPAPVNGRDPSVMCKGITGQITGNRANIIIPDDIETAKNSMSQAQRDNNRHLWEDFTYILKPLENTEILALGTPHNEDSIYNGLADQGYKIRLWPAQYGFNVDAYDGQVSPMLVADREKDPHLAEGGVHGLGAPTNPERFDDARLRIMAGDEGGGRSSWLMQMMLDVRAGIKDRHPLKVSDLIIYDCDPKLAPEIIIWGSRDEFKDLPNMSILGDRLHPAQKVDGQMLPYTRAVMWVDPSGRGEDETTYCVLKELYGRLFLIALGGFSGGYQEESVLIPLAQIASSYGVDTLRYEDNFGDGMFGHLLAPVMIKHAKNVHFHAEESGIRTPNTSKERRIIDTLEPVMNTHRLVVSPEVIRRDYEEAQKRGKNGHYTSLIYQMTRITSTRGCIKHDDRIDVLYLAVNDLEMQLNQDAERSMRVRQSIEDQKEWDEFMHPSQGRTMWLGQAPKQNRPEWGIFSVPSR